MPGDCAEPGVLWEAYIPSFSKAGKLNPRSNYLNASQNDIFVSNDGTYQCLFLYLYSITNI